KSDVSRKRQRLHVPARGGTSPPVADVPSPQRCGRPQVRKGGGRPQVRRGADVPQVRKGADTPVRCDGDVGTGTTPHPCEPEYFYNIKRSQLI
ncbi:MAG: hypothetical protein RR162_06105, partial [Oscillospiraceae bacterium]